MLETVIAKLPAALDMRILPVQAVGKSNEHLYAPGTLTVFECPRGSWADLQAGENRLIDLIGN